MITRLIRLYAIFLVPEVSGGITSFDGKALFLVKKI